MGFVLKASCLGLVFLAGCSSIDRSRNWSDPAVSGKTLAQQVCSNCHGVTGESTNPMIPKLAGQTSDYLESQLLAMRSRDRNDSRTRTYMWGPSEYLTNGQIKEIAEYFSKLPPMKSVESGSGDVVIGRNIYYQGIPSRGVQPCASCHGKSGEGDEIIPKLSGQYDSYMNARARVAMTKIVSHMDDAEIRGVVSYMSSVGAGGKAIEPLEPSDEKVVKLSSIKLPPTPAAFDADGDPHNCHYSVWTNGWYCGDFWNALLYRISGN